MTFIKNPFVQTYTIYFVIKSPKTKIKVSNDKNISLKSDDTLKKKNETINSNKKVSLSRSLTHIYYSHIPLVNSSQT